MQIIELDSANELTYFGMTHLVVRDVGDPLAVTYCEDHAKKIAAALGTDYDRMMSLYTDLKINFEAKVIPEENKHNKEAHHMIVVDQGVGYNGFEAVFYFDKDGKFLEHGVWE